MRNTQSPLGGAEGSIRSEEGRKNKKFTEIYTNPILYYILFYILYYTWIYCVYTCLVKPSIENRLSFIQSESFKSEHPLSLNVLTFSRIFYFR